MNKIKNFVRVISFVIIVCILGFFTLTTSFKSEIKEVNAATKPALTVSATMEKGYVKPSSSTAASITLKLDFCPTEDVTVSFYAEDVTAMVDEGDYYYISDDYQTLTTAQKVDKTKSVQTVILNSTNYNGVTINYEIGKATYACNNRNGELICNYFNFVIDSVDGASYSGSKKYKCRLNYDILLDIEKDSNDTYYYGPFRNSGKCYFQFDKLGHKDNSDARKTIKYSFSEFLGNNLPTIYNNTITQGWGQFHFCGWTNHMKAGVWYESNTYFTVYFAGDTSKQLVKEGIGAVNTGGENYEDNDAEHMDWDEEIYSGTTYYTEKDSWHTKTYIKVPTDWGYNFTLYIDNSTTSTKRYGNGYMITRLSDDVAPELEKYNINTDQLITEGKLRLILRYSELVDGHSSTINAYIGGIKPAIFRYEEGAGTNTLVYTCDLAKSDFFEENQQYTKIVIDSFDGSVYDLGYNWQTKSVNKAKTNFGQDELDVNIDLRNPQLSDASTERSSSVAQNRTVLVTASSISKGTLYYCWTKDKTGDYNKADTYEQIILGNDNTRYAGKISVNIDKDVGSQTYTIGSPLGLNGEYYLHVFLVSEYGKSKYQTYGVKGTTELESGYKFDNTSPTLTVDKDNSTTQFNKIYSFSVNDNFASGITGSTSGISLIGVRIYDESNTEQINDICLWDESSNIKLYDTGTITQGVYSGTFNFTLDKDNLLLKAKNQTLLELDPQGFGSYYYYFYAEDKAGNTTIIEPLALNNYTKESYDSRTQFDCSFQSNKSNVFSTINGAVSSGIQENVYDLSTNDGQLEIRFFNNEEEVSTLKKDVMSVYKIYYGSSTNLVYDSTKGGSYSDYISVKNVVVSGKKTDISITPLMAGYYKIEVVVDRTLTNDDTAKLYSNKLFEFYITNHTWSSIQGKYNYENTTNYLNAQGNLTLINKVFQLNNSYYYMYNEVATSQNYNNCVSPASFSSETKAIEYIRFMEYQDLQLCVIDSKMASFLKNGGSTKYQIADGQDSIEPISGQTWIRYKRSSWNENSSLEGWCYYFYSNRSETNINVNLLASSSPLLVSAMNSVVDYLYKKGTWVYLTEEEYFDSNNCPYLLAGQIHNNLETATKTMTGSNYSTMVTFQADSGMYLNTTTVGNTSYVVASGLKLSISDVTKLYYVNDSSNELVPINASNGQSLAKALGNAVGSGIIKIVELDGNGAREFECVLDSDAPVVTISWKVTGNDASETTVSNELNSSSNGEVYSAKTMSISSSKYTTEIDSLAYVAVYTVSQTKFVSITYYSELKDKPIELENGNYYIVVGDRYGNTYRFTAQVCDTEFEVKIEIINQEYVSVITNRTSDQIERFEVRCNNVLETTAYNEKGNKYYKDGTYSVFIKDIYGYTNSTNGSFGTDMQFERALPKLTWYYLNSNDAYSEYKANGTTAMNMTTSLESNTFFINTSRMLKFVYDGEYEYIFDGISDSDTVHSQNGHYVQINTNENWTLKIWYKSYPNVVATYICTNDTQAPNISCSYKIASYQLEESNTMNLSALSSPVNAYYYLNNIKFEKIGTQTENIIEGDWVNANLITVKATDASGISSVKVFLDGELYKEYTDIDGEFTGCSLSRTGVYKVVATDSFGNEKVMNFTNDAQSLVETSIDEAVIKNARDTIVYGNSTASFKLKENGLIYIKVGDYSLLYTIEDGKLLYTRYVNVDTGSDKIYIANKKTKTVLNDQGEYETQEDAFFDINSGNFSVGTVYEFVANNEGVQESRYFKELNGFKFYVSYNNKDEITIQFACENEDALAFDLSVVFEDYLEPYCYSVELSKETTDIDIESILGEAINCENNKVVRTNVDFDIVSEGETNLSEISKITYSYSPTKEFIEYSLIFEKQSFVKEIESKENGFYSLMITNKYGNTINYIINRSDVYSILGYAIYDDYVESSFDSNYGEELIKANSKVRFEAYTDYDDRNQFVLTKAGSSEAINFPYTYDNGYYIFTFDTEGVYQLTATDSFGNVVVKNFEINKSSNIEYKDSYMTGYNDKALLLSQGYTNNKLSIDLPSISADDIQYVSTITSSETTVNNYKVVKKTEKILYNTLTQDAVGLESKYAIVIYYEYTYYTENPTLTKKTKEIVNLLTGEILEENASNKLLAKTNSEYSTKLEGAIGRDGDNNYQVIFRDSYGSIAKKDIHYSGTPTLEITRHIRSEAKEQTVNVEEAIKDGIWSSGNVIFTTNSKKFTCFKTSEAGVREQVTTMPVQFAFTADSGQGKFLYKLEYLDEYGNEYAFDVHLVRQDIEIKLDEAIETMMIDNVETTRNNIKVTFTKDASCTYRLDSGEEVIYNSNDVLYKDGTYRFQAYDKAGNITTRVIRKDTVCEFNFKVGSTNKVLINGDVVNSGYVKFEPSNNDTSFIKAIYRNNELQENNTTTFSKDGLWTFLIEDTIGNIQLFEFNIITHKRSEFSYTTPFTYKITEFWYDSGDGILINSMELVTHSDTNNNSSFNIKEDGIYTVVMASTVYKNMVDFVFTIDTSVPQTTLVGCENGERTNADITFGNINNGDIITIYKNGELLSSVEISEKGDIPTITDGGEYTVVITNEAGVSTSLSFVRNNITNAAGSTLVIVIGLLYVVGILVGAIIHNRQKIDD